MRPSIAGALLASVALADGAALAQETTTEVLVLGVEHSAMLVAETYQPAVFRAFIERADPDAICIERAPEEFARGSHYEFTYEIQHIAVPYARERGIPLCPFDWLPSTDDQVLAFGIDIERPPPLRPRQGFGAFITFGDSAALNRDLFHAESGIERERYRAWYMNMAEQPRADFARRLFLYRTFLQAMRVARAAREFAGGRVLVIVGAMHKDDIEQILRGQPGVRITPPADIGAPTPEQVDAHVRLDDLAAIATFNLLGAQAATGNVDWDWLRRIVERLELERPGAEARLLRTRLGVLTGTLDPAAAARRYREIRGDPAARKRFTWDGVIDRGRIDSFHDPFGNLTIAERATLEEARELLRAGRTADAHALRAELEAALPPAKAMQLGAYWREWVEPAAGT